MAVGLRSSELATGVPSTLAAMLFVPASPGGGPPDFAPARATDAALAKSLVASPTALTQPSRASMRGSHAAAPSTLGLCVAWQGRAQSGQPPNNALKLTGHCYDPEELRSPAA